MAKRKAKKVVKKVVQKVLDKTDLDEKLVAKYNENPGLYNKILCCTKCYGGYVLAVGAGCLFGTSLLWGVGLLAAAAGWAYWATCSCKLCKGGQGTCCKS